MDDIIKKEIQKESLVDLYIQGDLDGVHELLDTLFVSTAELPLAELMFVLEDFPDDVIIQKIVGILTLHIDFIARDLIELYKNIEDDDLKDLLMIAISSKLNVANIQFLVEHYLTYKKYRDKIRSVLFTQTEAVLLILTAWLESHEVSEEQMALIEDFLENIDEEVYFNQAHAIGHLKIADVFYSLRKPPNKNKIKGTI